MNFTIGHAIDIAIQTFSALYADTPAKLLVLVLTLLLCFAGCRLMRWSSALYGVITGVLLGVCATSIIPYEQSSQINSLMQSILAMVIGGVVLGILAFRFRELGIFLACGGVGVLIAYVPATFVQQLSQIGFWCVLLGCGLLFGMTGVLFLKPACLLTTGLFGIPAGLTLIGLMGGSSLGVGILLGSVLTVAGCLVQVYLLRRMETKEELALQQTNPNLPIVPQEPEDLDDIDKISNRVAEHIGMAGSYHTADFTASDEPELVDDRTMLMSEMTGPLEESQTSADTEEAEEFDDRLEETASYAAVQEALEVEPEETPAVGQAPEGIGGSEETERTEASDKSEESGETEAFDKSEESSETEQSGESGETARFVWAVEETVKESAVLEQQISAEEEKLEEPEETAEEEVPAQPEPKLKKSRSWFFFGRKKKQPEEQEIQPEEPGIQSEELEEPEIRPELQEHQPEEKRREEPDDVIAAEEDTIAEVLAQFAAAPAEDSTDIGEQDLLIAAELVQTAGELLAETSEPMDEEIKAEKQDSLPMPEIESESEPVFRQTGEVLSEERLPEQVQKKQPFRWVVPVILVLAALAFAVIGIVYVEFLLTLFFAGYVLRYYRSAAFVCAVLCVRRVADVVILVLQQGSGTTIALDVVSGICFLVLTIAALRADAQASYETKK